MNKTDFIELRRRKRFRVRDFKTMTCGPHHRHRRHRRRRRRRRHSNSDGRERNATNSFGRPTTGPVAPTQYRTRRTPDESSGSSGRFSTSASRFIPVRPSRKLLAMIPRSRFIYLLFSSCDRVSIMF